MRGALFNLTTPNPILSTSRASLLRAPFSIQKHHTEYYPQSTKSLYMEAILIFKTNPINWTPVCIYKFYQNRLTTFAAILSLNKASPHVSPIRIAIQQFEWLKPKITNTQLRVKKNICTCSKHQYYRHSFPVAAE